jgi:uracil-DNA glycosylase
MFRAGLANQPTSVHAGDGLMLHDVRVVASVRCAPPANKPTPAERDTCRPWLVRELQLLPAHAAGDRRARRVRLAVALAGAGGGRLWRPRRRRGRRSAHGAEVQVNGLTVLGCYHVSQQNTFTGKLTEAMLDAEFTNPRPNRDESGAESSGRWCGRLIRCGVLRTRRGT